MDNTALRVCVDQLAAALEPPPRQTVSEWADANRRLSSEASAERGEWRTDRAPYQRAIIDALSPHSPYERVVVMSSSQVGKTEILNNFVGYIIDRDRGPTLVVEPRVEDGKSWSKDRLAPMLRETPCLRGKVSEVRSRDADNTTMHKRFPGGHIRPRRERPETASTASGFERARPRFAGARGALPRNRSSGKRTSDFWPVAPRTNAGDRGAYLRVARPQVRVQVPEFFHIPKLDLHRMWIVTEDDREHLVECDPGSPFFTLWNYLMQVTSIVRKESSRADS